MQVKGTAIKSIRDFMKNRFPDMYNKWIDSLPPESKSIYTSILDASAWYPLNEGYKIPVAKIIELCYPDDFRKGADLMGSYSAEVALRGVYKTFLLIASPQYLVKRASNIFTTYFKPSEIEVTQINSNLIEFRIKSFDSIDENLEYRIAGWIRKALELANCKNPVYTINRSLAKGDSCTEIHFSWQ
jgi:hypothetical protein